MARLGVLLLFGLVAIAVVAAVPSSSVSAVTRTSSLTPSDQARSFAYYKALRNCFATGAYKNSIAPEIGGVPVLGGFAKGWTMSATDAVNFDWFHKWKGVVPNPGLPIQGFADMNVSDVGVIIDTVDGDGVMNCGPDEGKTWLKAAASLWGYASGPDLLCALDFGRDVNQDNCAEIVPGATNDFHAPGGAASSGTVPGNLDSLWTGAWGSSGTGIESIGAGEYQLYLQSFKTACRAISPGSGDYTIYELNEATNTLRPVKYGVGDRDRGTGYSVRVHHGLSMTCQQLADILGDEDSRAVQAYRGWLKLNDGSQDNTGTGEQDCDEDGTCQEVTPSCGSEVSGVGWIICPVIAGLTGLNDGMWSLVSGLLTVDPLDDEGALYAAWGTIRNLANVAFVLVFLIVVFSQLTGAGISNYGVKKMLPRLILGALLVNVSYFIVAIAVDLANVIGASLYALIVGLAPEFNPSAHGWEALVNLITQGATVGGLAVAGVALAGGAATAFWMLLPLAALGALALLAAVVTLIFRQAAIPVLAILAPLAFVAYLLPNTESWYKKYQSLLLGLLMLFPLAAVVFGGVQFAALTIIGNGEDWWRLLIGLVMMTLPLFSLPFLARQGGPLLSKVGGALQGLAGKARQPLGAWAKGRQELARAHYKAGQPRRGPLGWSQRLYRRSAMRQKTRETDTATAGKSFGSQWAQSAEGQAATDRAGKASLQEGIDSAQAATRLENATRSDLTLRVRAAKQEQDAATKTTERLVREASTTASAPHLNSLDPATRRTLQTSQHSLDIDESAIGSANRVARTDYATRLTTNPVIATAAGGIDPLGAGRVANAAQAALTKERRERIQNIKDAAPESPSDHSSMATALLTAADRGDVETITAYAEMLADGGNPGVTTLREALSTAEAKLTPDRLQQLKDDVRRAPSITTSGNDFDEWTHSGETLADIGGMADTWNRLSPAQFAGMKQSSQQLAIAHLSDATVRAILADPETVNILKPPVRDSLVARSGSSAGTGGNEVIGIPPATQPPVPPDTSGPIGSATDYLGRQTPTGASDDYHDGMSK